MSLICCELVRRGRFVTAEPYFEGGALISLAHAKRYVGDVGKLAIVSAARSAGRVVEVLDTDDNIHAILRGLLAEAGVLGDAPTGSHDFGDVTTAVQDQLDAFDSDVPLVSQREDLRSVLAVTIDPNDARDHDDAVSFVPDPEVGGLAGALWVHIADVAAYVGVGTPLDARALDLGFSTYVPGTVAPMLPEQLSSDLCSLRAGVDRGCVSVCMQLTTDGEIGPVRFGRTLIRSARRLTYDQVDDILAGSGSVDPVIDELLMRLDAITRVLRQRRIERGALAMELPEVAFAMGGRSPDRAWLEMESPSHRLIEECMLLANGAVGRRLSQAQAPALFRVHEHPDPEAIEAMLAAFDRLSVPTPPVPEGMHGVDAARVAVAAAQLAQSYSRQRQRGVYAFAPRVLRALSQAVYQTRDGVHSGLATTSYAHFTSPIRRYPDLINHRSLLRLLGLSEEPPCSIDLSDVADHVNYVERAGMKVERRANSIVLAHLLYRRMYVDAVGDDEGWSGEIVGMIRSGLFVRFGEVFEGFLPARSLDPGEDRYELDEWGLAMVGSRSGRRFCLGDPIAVYVDRIDRCRGRIEVRLANRAG